MRNILCIFPDFLCVGGISKYNQNLLDVLINERFTVRVISRNDTKKEYRNLEIFSFGKYRALLLRKLLFSLRIFREVIFSKPTFIICGHINFSPLCYMIQKFLRIKYAILTHGVEVWNISGKLKLKALKQAHLITSVSNFTKHKIIEQVPETRDKVQLLFNTVDGTVFYPKPKPMQLMKKYNFGKDDKIILTVARLEKTAARLKEMERYKGYDKIINIFPDILKEIPEAKYIIVGTGSELENIKRCIRQKNLESSVILAGYITDSELADYYNLSDVFIMPSKVEGFGIVFLEALASGKPVIAGNKDGSQDAVLNGELGIMVDPDNESEIASTLVKVLRKEIPQKLLDTQYLRKKVLESYSLKRFKETVKTLIGSL